MNITLITKSLLFRIAMQIHKNNKSDKKSVQSIDELLMRLFISQNTF